MDQKRESELLNLVSYFTGLLASLVSLTGGFLGNVCWVGGWDCKPLLNESRNAWR